MVTASSSKRARIGRYGWGVLFFLALSTAAPPAPNRGHAVSPPAGTAYTAPSTKIPRPLPLNRFRWSRAAREDSQGFYYQPVGLCDDYPEESTTPERIRRDFELMNRAGVKLFRFGIGWDAAEPQPGKYDWRFMDEMVRTARSYHVALIPYVAYTPRWLAERRRDFWRQPPRDPKRFGDFMYALAERYRGSIQAWELWNEPDNAQFWAGSAAQYARMVAEGAQGVRRADPNAVIVLGGLAHEWGEFTEELVRLGAHRYVDVVNMHGYLETWDNARAEEYPARIVEMADLFSHDFRPDFWLAEFGYSTYRRTPDRVSDGVDAVYDYEHTPEYQAAALFKHHVLALAAGELSLTAWYRLHDLEPTEHTIGDDNNRFLGLLDRQRRPKPSYHAFRFFNRLFNRPSRRITEHVRIHRPPNSRSVAHVFEEKSGEVIVVGWLRSSTREEVADISGKATDRRREVLSVRLPGQARRKITLYNAQGEVVPTRVTWSNGWLRGIPLTGKDLFIAVLR